MTIFKFLPVQHSSDFPPTFAPHAPQPARYFMLLHDGGLISPAPIPNFLCLCFDLRVFAHGEIDKEESMVATFPSSTPGEKSTFFTSYCRPFLWSTLPAVWSVRTLHQYTCRLLARIPHSKCFISPTPRTLPRWSSRPPGEPHAAASACCARPLRLLVILPSRLMPTLQVSSLK